MVLVDGVIDGEKLVVKSMATIEESGDDEY